MSAKNTDRQGRLSSKTVAFRMSPEEADLLRRMADASDTSKRGYLIERALCREVTVIPNKRMRRHMEEGCCSFKKNSEGLKAAATSPKILPILPAGSGGIFAGLGREIDEESQQSEADMIMGMVR